MSMPTDSHVPHALRQAHKALSDQITAAKANWSLERRDLRDAADHFVRCLYDSPGARQQLERRASLIRGLTAEGSGYADSKKAAHDTCRKLMMDRQATKTWAVERGLEIEFSNAFRWKGSAKLSEDVRIELRNAENLLMHFESVGELTDEARPAIERYERECRSVVHLGLEAAADGCYQLWHLHSAIVGTGSRESRLVRAWLEASEHRSLWLDEIAAAADSLMAWVEASEAPAPGESSSPALKPSGRKAYLSFVWAQQRTGKQLKDRAAYDFLTEHDVIDHRGDPGELADYRLPSFGTWSRQVRSVRGALGEQKNTSRCGRGLGRTVVGGRDIEYRNGRDE